MGRNITILTLNGCSHCDSLKLRLKELNIPSTILDVDENEELWNAIVDETGMDYLPTIMFKDDDKNELDIASPTIHFETENEIVEMIQNYLKKEG